MSTHTSCSNFSNMPAESMEFTDKRGSLAQQLLSHLAQIENARKQMSAKRSVYDGISSELTKTFCTFTLYCDTLKYYAVVMGETEEPSHVERVRKTFDKLKNKMDYAGKIMDSFTVVRQGHVNTIWSTLKVVSHAQSLAELSSISIPSLDWLYTMPDPNVEQLADEWSELGMQPKIENFLGKVHNLILLNNADAPSSESDSDESPKKRKRGK